MCAGMGPKEDMGSHMFFTSCRVFMPGIHGVQLPNALQRHYLFFATLARLRLGTRPPLRNVPRNRGGTNTTLFLSFSFSLPFTHSLTIYFLVLTRSKNLRGLRPSRRWNNKASGCSCLWLPFPQRCLISDFDNFVATIDDRFTADRTDRGC